MLTLESRKNIPLLAMIYAESLDNVIGKSNELPWHIPEDMRLFFRMTADKVVIMGRKTFESLGSKPLPRRVNIVVTTNVTSMIANHPEVLVAESLDVALWLAKEKPTFIIGGSALFDECYPICDVIYRTLVHRNIKEQIYSNFPNLKGEKLSHITMKTAFDYHEFTEISVLPSNQTTLYSLHCYVSQRHEGQQEPFARPFIEAIHGSFDASKAAIVRGPVNTSINMEGIVYDLDQITESGEYHYEVTPPPERYTKIEGLLKIELDPENGLVSKTQYIERAKKPVWLVSRQLRDFRKNKMHPVQYLSVECTPPEHEQWTTDPNEAVRFSREKDAICIGNQVWQNPKIVEHIFED